MNEYIYIYVYGYMHTYIYIQYRFKRFWNSSQQDVWGEPVYTNEAEKSSSSLRWNPFKVLTHFSFPKAWKKKHIIFFWLMLLLNQHIFVVRFSPSRWRSSAKILRDRGYGAHPGATTGLLTPGRCVRVLTGWKDPDGLRSEGLKAPFALQVLLGVHYHAECRGSQEVIIFWLSVARWSSKNCYTIACLCCNYSLSQPSKQMQMREYFKNEALKWFTFRRKPRESWGTKRLAKIMHQLRVWSYKTEVILHTVRWM